MVEGGEAEKERDQQIDPEPEQLGAPVSAASGRPGQKLAGHGQGDRFCDYQKNRDLRREKDCGKDIESPELRHGRTLQTGAPGQRSPKEGGARVLPRPQADGLEESFQFMRPPRSNRRT